MPELLEHVMMDDMGLSYRSATRLVSHCRDRLGMTRYDAWTEELHQECVRVVRASQAKAESKRKSALLDETSATESEDFEGPVRVSVLQESAPMRDGNLMENFFGVMGPATNSATHSRDANNEKNVVSNFFGQNVETGRRPSVGTIGTFLTGDKAEITRRPSFDRIMHRRPSVAQEVPVPCGDKGKIARRPSFDRIFRRRPSVAEQTRASTLGQSMEEKRQRVAHLQAAKPQTAKDSREHHLSDPTARLTPLEALFMRRFDIGFEDVSCLVADARANLGTSKFEPWTDKLYIECEKIYASDNRKKNGLGDRTETDVEGSYGMKGWSNFYEGNQGDDTQLIGIDDASFQEKDDVSGGASSYDESSGWDSKSGWSSVWGTSHGGYSYTTHDEDDAYSVGIIQELKQSNYRPGNYQVVNTKRRETKKTSKDASSIQRKNKKISADCEMPKSRSAVEKKTTKQEASMNAPTKRMKLKNFFLLLACRRSSS